MAILFLFLFLLPAPCLSQQSALLQFKNSLTKSDSLYNWKDDGSNPCDPHNVWVGIICSNGIITIINLSDMDLQGQPDVTALQPIDGLKALSIQNNSLAGPMPEINRLPFIKSFYAGSNWFSGVIPSDFFQTLGSLKKLWLQHNNFSGQIPTSIGELPNLKELHLEYNEFSGPIPAFVEPDIITTLDLSSNRLQGEIPKSLNKFDAKVFENNANLCGSKLSKECKAPPDQLEPTTDDEPKSSVKWIIMIVVVALLILIILAGANQIEQDGRPLGKEGIDEAVVNIPTVTKKSTTTSSSSKPYNNNSSSTGTSNTSSSSNTNNNNNNNNNQNSSIKVSRPQTATAAAARPVGDMVMVNEERGIFGLQDLMKAAAEVLGNGGLGSAYKATLGSGVSVVVKRVREMNQMTKEVFDTEMKKLAKLKHQNILTPLAYHFRKEEKLLVSEYVSKGSLLYVLHGERGISHAQLNWDKRLKIIKGVARGMGFLHREFASYPLPHGDLKSSNVLIGSDYEPLLSDYAFYPLLNNTPTLQSMFAFKSPEATLNQNISQKSDVYCMGIIILEIITGKYPSQYCNNQKSGTDVVQWVKSALAENRGKELIDPEIAAAASPSSVLEMEKILHIGAACTESEPDERIDLTEAIRRIDEKDYDSISHNLPIDHLGKHITAHVHKMGGGAQQNRKREIPQIPTLSLSFSPLQMHRSAAKRLLHSSFFYANKTSAIRRIAAPRFRFRFLSSEPPFSDDFNTRTSSSFTQGVGDRHHNPSARTTTLRATYEEEQARVLAASLHHVIRLGWTEAAMIAGARDVAVSPSIVGAIPRKEAALVEYFMDECLQKLIHKIDSGELQLQDLVASECIAKLIKLRLQMQAPYISKWPQALSIQAQPSNISTSFKQRAMLVDEFWHASNDQGSGVDWYIKRTVVGGIYLTTEIYMLTDNSTDFEDTWVFLKERVRDAFDLKKTFQEVKYFAEAVGAGLGSSLHGFAKKVSGRQRNEIPEVD
ncbi:hypothetical protein L1987_70048 [Smallanthus sonchifolius]|uniref:Uncharacterized protein n=1 Tax=Smallanthus sonchifolius TaxID=185202 RepID=A0ACB9APF1_9ASTR|nr:hypothetical protein L1987_70048 [Smallanthus sonchifolius]